jgi:hypothetical protein
MYRAAAAHIQGKNLRARKKKKKKKLGRFYRDIHREQIRMGQACS